MIKVWLTIGGFVLLGSGMVQAGILKPSLTRSSAQDLEVKSEDASRFYTFAQLEKLPQTTVKTEDDPNTHRPATYTGVTLDELLSAIGTSLQKSAIAFTCYDGYVQYYDSDYIREHNPILLLRYDGKPPAQWPKSEHNTDQAPYSIVHERFVARKIIYGYTEQPRIPYGIVSAQIIPLDQVTKAFNPQKNADSQEVIKGQQIAMGSCISCHNNGEVGGSLAQRPFPVLAVHAATNGQYFRNYIVDPKRFNPASKMPPHPTFDTQTLDALQAYFKALSPF
jgi:mono/diheme cytochrome c family protein